LDDVLLNVFRDKGSAACVARVEPIELYGTWSFFEAEVSRLAQRRSARLLCCDGVGRL
jgi:hypothetical protein